MRACCLGLMVAVVAWGTFTGLARAQTDAACNCEGRGGAGGPGLGGYGDFSDGAVFPPINRFDQFTGCAPAPLWHDSPRQLWYVIADAVAFKRDSGRTEQFAALGTPTDFVLGTDDLRFEFQGGLRTLMGTRLNDWYDLEASYFGLLTWDEFRAVRDVTANGQGSVGNLTSPFSNFGTPTAIAGLDFNTFASIHYTTSLDNLEINLRQRLDTKPSQMEASLLYGFRYMSIRERFDYLTQSLVPAGGSTNGVSVHTTNDVYGFQLGAILEFRVHRRAWIDVDLKAVVCHNDAAQDTSYAATTAGVTNNFAGAVSEERTTFIGDAAVALSCQFRPRLLGRIGYQAIWVDGVALASENFQTNVSLLTLGPAQLDHDGNVVYHGPFAGLLYTW